MESLRGGISGIGASISPFAKRTQRMIQEKFGNVDDVTELPPDFVELENKTDALRTAESKLLSVISTYESEGYDYPPNLKESLMDFSKVVSEKAQNLAHANNLTEAQSALIASNLKKTPKTLNHAISRAALVGAQEVGPNEVFGRALEEYALAQEKVGQARLNQDALINSRFNTPYRSQLTTTMQVATKARKRVNNTRLNLDSAKSQAKQAKPEKMDELRAQVEHAEDEFVTATEEAASVMKNLLESPQPIVNLQDLIEAQRDYYFNAYQALNDILPEIQHLVNQDEHHEDDEDDELVKPSGGDKEDDE